MKKDLTSINDLSKAEILSLLAKSIELKQSLKTQPRLDLAPGTMGALIFEKPSLRTRVTFERAMVDLGGSAIYLGPSDIGLGKRETVPDVARNLSRWVNCIIARVFEHSKITELAANASVPVVNALCNEEHPCQILADLLTVHEHRGSLEGATICWTGDGNNVCNSLMLACGLVGINLRVATPKGFEPPQAVTNRALEYAKESGASIVLTYDPKVGARDADYIYTDVWASMGQEAEMEQRKQIFRPYQLNRELMAQAKPGARVLHCLPAHRGEEISADVLDGPQSSTVLDQAENRLHAQRALLAVLLTRR
ncbi:ornithine carbamoyltransferase [candidate division WOR-3 bacterium]|uniref:Ornithine carbamoyltransferase n=1 Tax=candidate division WOR-3 bacterium TaxID=2052148 RepID=A0A937XK68_UNCW3|nr:ornithine carbamoyltransferase [candidate division WOR-3 bacterium]